MAAWSVGCLPSIVSVSHPIAQLPLHYAALLDHSDAVSALVERKAQLEAKDDQEETALHLAAKVGHPAVVTVLCGLKANPNATNRGFHPNDEYDGASTPLHLAARYGHADCVRVLCRAYADLQLRAGLRGWVGLLAGASARLLTIPSSAVPSAPRCQLRQLRLCERARRGQGES